MKTTKIVAFMLAFFAYNFCISQNDIDLTGKQIDINELIKLKKSDKQQQSLLISFKNSHGSVDEIMVKEYKDFYEITVDHQSKAGYTGGAECYKLDKKTGKSEMIWHEHPMKIEILEEEKE